MDSKLEYQIEQQKCKIAVLENKIHPNIAITLIWSTLDIKQIEEIKENLFQEGYRLAKLYLENHQSSEALKQLELLNEKFPKKSGIKEEISVLELECGGKNILTL